MTDRPRLIEVAFPLKQASIDSVHEKNVRHGHISTLHIWPARRPLAACRAALIATLLPDPGNDEERQKLLEMIAGTVVRKTEKDKIKEETVGGILHWGRENGSDMDKIRKMIRDAYGGRAPKVLDPFAGGGAIPLEAMRLGCEATAIDINPVAWFLLKCTLEYPQKLAGKTSQLPAWWKPEEAGKKKKKKNEDQGTFGFKEPESRPGDLAAHVRAWGQWVLDHAREDLEKFYPIVDGKPTVAYLWARSVTCKSCRAAVPLLKTRWLCKKDNKRIVLKVHKHEGDPPTISFTAESHKQNDDVKGTMNQSGAKCLCCSAVMTTEDIQVESTVGRWDSVPLCAIMDSTSGREYRSVSSLDDVALLEARKSLTTLSKLIPLGLPEEPIDPARPSPNARGLSGLTRYGLTSFDRLYNARQLASIMVLIRETRSLKKHMVDLGYDPEFADAIRHYLALAIDRVAERNSTLCHWDISRESISGTFQRYALRVNWDYCEANPFSRATGGYLSALDWIDLVVKANSDSLKSASAPIIQLGSATASHSQQYDVILTDPPYDDAIPYSDLSDFFYVLLRRVVQEDFPDAFHGALTPKDQELIQHAGRLKNDNKAAKQFYEDGMASAFKSAGANLSESGRFVVVFAHKHPDAWETLASAIVRAGFIVSASWPIQTEMPNKAAGGARLASSVWLVCKKRPLTARAGWDNKVLQDMQTNIYRRLADFWKAGIRGPDFVWAATGPALEAYSKHPIVKKANSSTGEVLTVSEFLREVRRIVVDFVVAQVLHANGQGSPVLGLDDLTTYYLLHRHDFGLEESPVGPCILYAVSCGLSDSALVDRHEILVRTGGKSTATDDDEDAEEEDEETSKGSGSKVKLKAWTFRKKKTLGEVVDGKQPPLIDQVHKLMHLWKAGDVAKVDAYLDDHGLRREAMFHQLLQALIELAQAGSEERSLLESISNHVQARGEAPKPQPGLFDGNLFAKTGDA